MGLVRTWTGQLARAAGASLIAPLVLLLASSVVASGGGLASFRSLSEIASGPTLPDVGLADQPGSALEGAEIVGAGPAPTADVSRTQASLPNAPASAAPPARAEPGPTVVAPSEGTGRGPVARIDPGSPRTPPVEDVAIPTRPSPPPVPAAPRPVDDLVDATRELGDTLRTPLEPLTNAILDLLRGPPRR